MTAYQISPDYYDDIYTDILFDFAMNFDVEGIKAAWQEMKRKEEEQVSINELRELGYSEEMINNAK